MNAEQARRATIEAIDNINSQYQQIQTLIKQACSNGQYQIFYASVHPVVLDKLTECDGFNVEFNDGVNISWKK